MEFQEKSLKSNQTTNHRSNIELFFDTGARVTIGSGHSWATLRSCKSLNTITNKVTMADGISKQVQVQAVSLKITLSNFFINIIVVFLLEGNDRQNSFGDHLYRSQILIIKKAIK